jgi:hypothetical protein
MNLKLILRRNLPSGLLAMLLPFTLQPSPALANVYATNIKLNGGTTDVVMQPSDNVTVSYILNEPASLGVTLNILSTTGAVRTLAFPANAVGARKGVNTVIWDGKNSASNDLAPGTYSVSITAAAVGYTNWTQITDDNNPWNYVYDGHGIAVDRNTNSPYYGRIFVANASIGNNPTTIPGDQVGIQKINADGSPADEGIFTTGGHTWSGNSLSPWKLEVSNDDFVYVSDLARLGEVYRWEPGFSAASQLYVLRQDNVTNRVYLTGMALFRNGTNTEVWAADSTNQNSLGILKWVLATNALARSNDAGLSVVGVGGDLNLFPSDVALDAAGNIYTCQFVSSSGDPSPRVFCFPAYDPSTNQGAPQLTARWAVGSTNDNYGEASGIAVDPTGTYVAVAFQGIETGITPAHGNTAIFYATNGAVVTSLDLDQPMDGDPSTEHQNTDCAWDAVGNIYYIDNWYGYWRAFSPPGTNQATTVATVTVRVPAPPAPEITAISTSNGVVTITFTAGVDDTAGAFAVLGAGVISGPYSVVSGVSFSQIGPGEFQATFTNNGSMHYFRIARKSGLSTQAPYITSIQFSGTDLIMRFTGAATDSASAFAVVAAPSVTGPYSAPGYFLVIQDSPGLFHAVVHSSGPRQFYRIKR